MEYCAEHAIPHSKFLSWEQEDIDKVLAWQLYSRSKCPRCGSFPDEWVDSEGREVTPPPMYAHTRRCFGCATLGLIEDRLRKENRHDTTPYLSILPPDPREDDEDDWYELT